MQLHHILQVALVEMCVRMDVLVDVMGIARAALERVVDIVKVNAPTAVQIVVKVAVATNALYVAHALDNV